ncbi:MAG: DUF6056 family protein [Cyclobacteriaceae bacterium]|nr:DUF6056 family protein [Cyclobacteriaceae bacterium]
MDDFWIRADVLSDGLFNVQWKTYWRWDGRAISPLYTDRLVILRFFDYQFAWVTSLISILFLLGTAFFLVKIFLLDFNGPLKVGQVWLFALFVFFVLVLVFRPHLSRTVFWATGSLYSHSNFFSIYLAYRFLARPNSKINLLWIYICMSSGPNSGMMLLIFLFFGYFLKVIKIKQNLFWIYFLFGCITLMLIVFAPGNFVRADGHMDFNIVSMIGGGFQILKEYIGMSLWLLPGSILISISVFPFLSRSPTLLVLFGLAALGSILPFLPMPSAASRHTVIFFQTFLLISCIQFWCIVLDYLGYSNRPVVSRFFSALLVLIFSWQVINQFLIGRAVKVEIDRRHAVLERNRGSDVELVLQPIILSDDNWTNRFSDVDPNFESNIYYEKYFNISKVSIAK